MLISSLNNNLFRQNAINNLNSLDDIHSVLKIINPSEWLWIMVSMLALTAILIWGLFGTITLNVDAPGILFPTDKLTEIESLISQTIKDRTEKVASLDDLYNKKKRMFEKHYLTIDDLLKAKEEYIAAREDLSNPNKNSYMSLTEDSSNTSINSSNTTLEALVFVDHLQGKKITVGMDAYILPNSFSQYDYGYIYGKVVSISEYPISKQLAYSYIGNMNLVDEFFLRGAPFIVKIQLKTDRSMVSGLSWTTKLGSNFSIQPGTMVSTKIIYKKCSPFRFISKI